MYQAARCNGVRCPVRRALGLAPAPRQTFTVWTVAVRKNTSVCHILQSCADRIGGPPLLSRTSVTATLSVCLARCSGVLFHTEVKAELKSDIGGAKTEIAALEDKVWRAGFAIAALAVLLNKFLDWMIR